MRNRPVWLAALVITAAFSMPVDAVSPQDHAAHHPRTAAVVNTAPPIVYSGIGGVTLLNNLVSLGMNASLAKQVSTLVEQVRAYAKQAAAMDARRTEGNARSQAEGDVALAAFMHAELIARLNIISILGADTGSRVNEALFGPDIRAGSLGRLNALSKGSDMTPADSAVSNATTVTDLSGLDATVPDKAAADTMYDQMMKMMNMMQPHMKDMMGGSKTEVPKRLDLGLPGQGTDTGTGGGL